MDTEVEKLGDDELRVYLAAEMNSLRRFSYSLTGNSEDADDMVQGTVERVLRSGLPANGPKPWLIRVCKNLWIDEIRKRQIRNHDELDDSLHSEGGSDLDARVSDERQLDDVAVALEKLSEEHRLILSMIVIEGLPYAEVATVLEVPVGTVMSRVSRARAKLKILLEGNRDVE